MFQKMLQGGGGGGFEPKLLWTNPNPDTAMGDGTTINVNTSGYDELIVICKYTITNIRKQRTIINKNDDNTNWFNTISVAGLTRNINNWTDEAITLSIGENQTGAVNASFCIPLEIYGIKK